MISALKAQLNPWSLLPVLFITVIGIILLNNNLAFDLISFKDHNLLLHRILIYVFIVSPVLFLISSKSWRKQSFHIQLVLFSIVAFSTATNFKVSQAFQLSLIFGLSSLYYFWKEKKIYSLNMFHWAVISYFIVDLVSLLWSLNSNEGINYLGNISPLIYVPLFFSMIKLKKTDFDLILIVIFRVSLLILFLSIVSWILQGRYLKFPLAEGLMLKKYSIGILDGYELVFAWTNYIHPTYLSLNILLSISIGWYYLLKQNVENSITYLEMLFLIAASLLVSIISASRFMQVSVLTINFIGILYVFRKNLKMLVIFNVLALVLLSVFVIKFSEKISEFTNDPIRNSLHEAAYQGIDENTWHGSGLGGMVQYINNQNPVFAPFNFSDLDFDHIHPHNQFIGDFFQTGIFGIAALLFILVSIFYLSYKQRNWLLAANGILLILLMYIEMPLIYKKGIFWFALTFCILVAKAEADTNEIKNTTNE